MYKVLNVGGIKFGNTQSILSIARFSSTPILAAIATVFYICCIKSTVHSIARYFHWWVAIATLMLYLPLEALFNQTRPQAGAHLVS